MPNLDIDAYEKSYQEDEAELQEMFKGLSQQRKEGYYIRQTILELKRFNTVRELMSNAHFIKKEFLEMMVPYDPEFMDPIVKALLKRPASQEEEDALRRINRTLREPKPPGIR